MSKLILFDCDETLWHSPTKDYISSQISPLTLVGQGGVQRQTDGLMFSLRPGVRQALRYALASGYVVGVVSDNLPAPVLVALRLFGLKKFIADEAINIRLWEGYCPKEQMVSEILQRPRFIGLKPGSVLWLDDKDYSAQAKAIGVGFIKVDHKINLYTAIKQWNQSDFSG